MKKCILPLLVFFALTNYVNAQSACSQYYPLVEGATMEYTNYDKKGKEDGVMHYKVTNVKTSGSTDSATMMMTMTDKKGNEFSSEYDILCEGDIVKIDFESLMNEQMMNQFGDMEMEMSGVDIEIPNNLSVGQRLPDANINIKVTMGGGMNMNMNVDTVNRKVEKKEKVTTPAGSFDCYVIYSDTQTKMMMANQSFPTRVWLAEGVGMVKQETYNKNRKLMSSTLLTAYNK
ncbi:hypothetical protein GCM10011414_00100 [Croceivirga lutea]|uniref:TapB family protein n=1 Tax=Croceivirga lutea TaxID=1775167 RepID=UPI00163A07B2|nr:hypothetical protein [Croceivirga lutea]GGG34634.1 hypothetical protein GCM10011414_00100 [Croceivirga lutea]